MTNAIDHGEKKFWAIIPAAGRSRRMTAFKPLLPWPPDSTALGNNMSDTVLDESHSVIQSAVECFLNVGIGGIVVAIGYRGKEIQRLLDPCDVFFVRNPDPEAPMSSSVVLALRRIPADAPVFILPGDHPGVAPETIRAMIRSYNKCPEAIHIPVFLGKRGHPSLFHPSMRDEMSHPDPQYGFRTIIRSGKYRVIELELDDPGIRINLDYPADYFQAERFYRHRKIAGGIEEDHG